MGALLILYQLLYFPLACGVLLAMVLRGRAKSLRESPGDFAERLGLAPRRLDSPVWLHAASVGEAIAAGALAAELKRRGLPLVVTTTTVAGRRKALELGLDARLAPIDLFLAVSPFLERIQPRCLILIETELWPTTLWLLRRQGIPVGMANARMTERSFSRYRLSCGFFRPLLGAIERAAAQTEADARRLCALGLPASGVLVAGNIKNDVPPPAPEAAERARRLLDGLWPGRPRWVAGSSWRDEEPVLVEAQRRLAKAVPGAAWVLAPRHVERAGEVAALLKKAGISFARLSELEPSSSRPAADCLLVDRIGELPSLYAAAEAAFVGGTLNGIGGHNVLEPAQAGRPVLFGTHVHKTSGAAQALIDGGGGFFVSDAAELAAKLELFLTDSAAARSAGVKARGVAQSLAGAAARAAEHLAPLWAQRKD
ncbi:MAG TPA: glycosyltransferase N-terminal domain-containing protein [Elusimicrobiota bacterium]|nr:glycosyltransferase N-terminal domain-containing protein [Elusimicrobiota bacterium]